MNKTHAWVLLVLFSWIGLSSGPAFADPDNTSKALEERVAELERQVLYLTKQLEAKAEQEGAKVEEAPTITASSKEGFSIKSPDDKFKLKVTGYAQAEGKFFTGNKKDIGTTDTFQMRTVRLTAQGTVAKDYDYNISPEFAGTSVSLPDAYVDVHYWPEAKLRAGKFKEPFGLERLQATPNLTFAELGLPSNLAPNRDVGAQIYGDLWQDSVSYAVGVFNGVEDLGSSITDGNNDKDVAARLFIHPFKNTYAEPLQGLGVGLAMTYGHKEGTTGSLPTYRSPGQASIFSYATGISADGPHSRLSPQFYYAWNSLGVLGEYIVSNEEAVRTASGQILREKFTNEAWQIAASYVLTGEKASYKSVNPKNPFSWEDRTWGAFEVAGRYGELDIDDDVFLLGYATTSVSVSKAEAWGLGLNWYFNKNFRFQLDYERTEFSGGGGIDVDRATENVIWSRFQIVF